MRGGWWEERGGREGDAKKWGAQKAGISGSNRMPKKTLGRYGTHPFSLSPHGRSSPYGDGALGRRSTCTHPIYREAGWLEGGAFFFANGLAGKNTRSCSFTVLTSKKSCDGKGANSYVRHAKKGCSYVGRENSFLSRRISAYSNRKSNSSFLAAYRLPSSHIDRASISA